MINVLRRHISLRRCSVFYLGTSAHYVPRRISRKTVGKVSPLRTSCVSAFSPLSLFWRPVWRVHMSSRHSLCTSPHCMHPYKWNPNLVEVQYVYLFHEAGGFYNFWKTRWHDDASNGLLAPHSGRQALRATPGLLSLPSRSRSSCDLVPWSGAAALDVGGGAEGLPHPWQAGCGRREKWHRHRALQTRNLEGGNYGNHLLGSLGGSWILLGHFWRTFWSNMFQPTADFGHFHWFWKLVLGSNVFQFCGCAAWTKALLLGAASSWLRRESSAPHDGGPKGSAGISALSDGLGLLVI